jgi:hypothetical protein
MEHSEADLASLAENPPDLAAMRSRTAALPATPPNWCELVRDTETDLLYHHSRRVFPFGALAGKRKNLAFDPELLSVGAMFHDMGLVLPYSSPATGAPISAA